MRKIFAHIHIPKCGGSSTVDFLARNFGGGLRTTNGILNDYQYDDKQIAKIIDYYPEMTCITGHKLSLNLPYNRKDLEITAFTWIRDPVERFISHYFFHKNHTKLVPEAKAMDLFEYTEWALQNRNQEAYINGQMRFLRGGSLGEIRTMISDGRLHLYPLSKLQESFYTLANIFPNTFFDLKVRSKNISKKDQDVPAHFRKLVLPYMEEDIQLLELAKQTILERGPPEPEWGIAKITRVMRATLGLKAAKSFRWIASYIETNI